SAGSLSIVSSLHDGQLSPDARLATPVVQPDALTARSVFGVAVLERRTVAVHGGPEAIQAGYPRAPVANEAMWARGQQPPGSMVVVPLVRQGEVFGVIAVPRNSPDQYTPQQIALLETFADQAVIAIENTRLLDELRHKTDELEQTNLKLEEASRHKSQF